MSLEYTKHVTEKDLHRDLPSVRDIRTVLLHFSLVTPDQQLKQSFQTFATLPVDETRQLTSHTHQVSKDEEMSVGSDRPGVIAKDLLKSLILSAVSLDDAVVDPWMKATRYGPVDFAEVCCTSDSLLSGAVTSIGGRAVQYGRWNGFDLGSSCEETAGCVDDSSLYHTTHTTVSIKIKVSSSTNEHFGCVSLACEARLV